MKNKERILNKIYAGFIALMFIGLVFSSIMATRTITDTSDTILSTITSSAGYSDTATAAHLQTAINGLNNLSGWVDGGNNNISISASIKLGTNCELRNIGLYLTTASNKTMITNYNTAGNNGIYIHDVYLNGNGLNQPEWWRINADASEYANAMYFNYCSNLTIKHATLYNMAYGGIFDVRAKHIVIDDVRAYRIGALYKYSGSGYDAWFSCGVWLRNCSESTINNMIVNDVYSCGVILESHDYTPISYWDHNIVVSDCTVQDASFGFYGERVRDCTFTNCIAEDCTETQIYGAFCGGFRIFSLGNRTTVENCQAKSCGYGFLLSGYYTTVTGCTSYGSTVDGFLVEGANCTIDSCRSEYDGSDGFQVEALNVTISDTTVLRPVVCGIKVWPSATPATKNKGSIIQGCTILNAGSQGIYSNAHNLSIIGNIIYTTGDDGIELTGNDLIISDNKINMPVGRSIYLTGSLRVVISGNNMYGGSLWGNAVLLSNTKNVSCSGNVIMQSATNTPEGGIVESGTADYTYISADNFIKTAILRTITGTHSWGILVNVTVGSIGIQRSTGTHWVIS
jgi:hypothetical protein